MSDFDLLLRGGECVTPSGRRRSDVGVRDDAEPAADAVSTELRDILGNTHDVETYRELIEALIFMERHK